MSRPEGVLAIVGATATGKSELAVALSERLGGEIVSADAFAVYRGFDAATAKPGPELLARAPHYLVDAREPTEPWSAGEFAAEARRLCLDILSRGKLPILAGGTGFYVRAFFGGLFEGPRRSDPLRRALETVAARRGVPYLKRMVSLLDPEVAGRLAEADASRAIRLLEILLLSGERPSRLFRERPGEGWTRPSVKILLTLPRPELHGRIAERFRSRFATALPHEVRGLLAAGIPLSAPAFSAIGYRDTAALVAGALSEAEWKERILRDTRRYAKRQETWFRREPGLVFVSATRSDLVDFAERLARPLLLLFRGPKGAADDWDAQAAHQRPGRVLLPATQGQHGRRGDPAVGAHAHRADPPVRQVRCRRRGRRARGDDLQARDRISRIDRDTRPGARARACGGPPPRVTRARSLVAAILIGVAAGCATAPPREDASLARARVVAANADADAADGRLRDALDGYREACRLAPADARYAGREQELRDALVGKRAEEASEALERKDVAAARRAAVSILEIDPQAAEGYRSLARAAKAEGALEDAWSASSRAHEIDPSDAAWTEFLAELAARTGRWAEAEALYEQLGRSDSSFREKAAAARVEFRVQNLPPVARRAALSPRVTRAQLASLLVELSPEVRDARVPAGAEVAVDVVDRPERTALVRTIGLGFFPVSRETHLAGPDVPVARTEMVSHLRRLAALAGGDLACAGGGAAASLARDAGYFPKDPGTLTGREAVGRIEATLRVARSGGSR